MLNFAAPSDCAQTRGFDFYDYTLQGGAHADRSASAVGDADRARHLAQTRYWPSELLDTFILKMAATGQCVHTAMMLGDRQYAMAQLAKARGARDDELVALAARLQAYFEADAPEACAVAAAMFHGADARLVMA